MGPADHRFLASVWARLETVIDFRPVAEEM